MKSLKNYLILSITLLGIVYSSQVSSQNPERNKEVVRKLFLEVLGNKKLDLYKSIHATDFVGHGLKKDYTLEEDFQASKQISASYTDGKIFITHLVAEGNLVSARWIVDAIMSGRKMVFDGFTIFKIEDEKIKEEWSLVNQMEMFRQSEAN